MVIVLQVQNECIRGLITVQFLSSKANTMEQSRKKFLKHFLIGATTVPLIMEACKKDTVTDTSTTTTTTTTGTTTTSGSCTVTATETAGPFPTITPSSLVRSDIRLDRTGVAFTINVTIKNTDNSCAALSGALVDIWHCDKDGYYSEYGGTSMQTVDYTAVHFLRGRQTTDSNGLVTFTSIFPGWYQSRATHIHVHVYTSAGTSLLISQISFPEGASSAVVLVNASTANGYSKGMTGYTYNASDDVFKDDTAGAQTGTVTGSVSAGYALAITLYAAA
jgi:protocatechuate 3,4-dioxygenase beta subunit